MRLSMLMRMAGLLSREAIFRSMAEVRGFRGDGRLSVKSVLRASSINKAFLTLVFSALSSGIALTAKFMPIASWSYASDSITIAVYMLVSFFIVLSTGLPLLTSIVSSNATRTLASMPISERCISWANALAFIRMYDAPLAALILPFPIVFGVLKGCPHVIPLLLLFSVVNFMLAFSCMVLLTKVFYSKVASWEGGTSGRSFARGLMTALWGLGVFGSAIVVNVLVSKSIEITSVIFRSQSLFTAMSAAYPFSMGFLTSTLTAELSSGGMLPYLVIQALASCLYTLLAFVGFRWSVEALMDMCMEPPAAAIKGGVRLSIKPSKSRAAAFLKRDLKSLTRSPSQAFVVALPVVIGVMVFLVSKPGLPLNLVSGSSIMVSVMGILSFLSPYVLGSDASATSFTQTLPIRLGEVLFSKSLLILALNAASMVIVVPVIWAYSSMSLDAALCIALSFPSVMAGVLVEYYVLAVISGVGVTSLNVALSLAKVIPSVLAGIVVSSSPYMLMLSLVTLRWDPEPSWAVSMIYSLAVLYINRRAVLSLGLPRPQRGGEEVAS
ncbi:MAG: hypothetical protein DRJ62_03220 [Thermoprotei archaeon]|nr:MAG: hypothetical protein DRJ62_03220 [Thermoprotei archaeon]